MGGSPYCARAFRHGTRLRESIIAHPDMTERDRPEPFKDLDDRLRRAHEASDKVAGRKPGRRSSRSGLGFAMRLGVELVSALIVGVAIGYFLDRWLGTKPWLTLLFFVLGSAAGFINVYRVMTGLGQGIGYPRDKADEDKSDPAS